MDEWTLNDLLECSVCLERLDTSSKVLPCQHTFCKKCLEDIVSTHKELRCPECRILVDVKIDDLPPNVLLMRILEGMRNSGPNKRVTSIVKESIVAHPTGLHFPSGLPVPSSNSHAQSELRFTNKTSNQPYARAVYDYLSKEPGDLSFKKGDIIILRKKIDSNWYHGECSGHVGAFPLSYVQIMSPSPSHIPQCKALYDFRMASDDEEGCLTFTKGDVITVIRRIDENWAEGKLDDHIGIFPLAFVELNNVARTLIKLSCNTEPGTSRVAPPTPVTEDVIPLIMSNTVSTPKPQQMHSLQVSAVTCSSTTTDTTSSSSVTSPSSSSTTPTTSSSSTPSSPASPPHCNAPPPPNKRHSFGSLHINNAPSKTNRHSVEILSPPDSCGQPQSLPTDLLNSYQVVPLQRQSSQRHRRSASSEVPPIPGPQSHHTSILLPATYVALYPYKPQKVDELELKRGTIYLVTERCQDGWFKGTSIKHQKCGVFPGNYVAPAKSLPAIQAQMQSYIRACRSGNNTGSPRVAPPPEPRSTLSYARSSPRHHAGCPGENTTHKTLCQAEQLSTAVVAPPNMSVEAACTAAKSNDKNREKKEKTVNFMRRLTSMKKSKSPPTVSYSMDNPVFEDTSSIMSQALHVRSGSCPNQLLTTIPSEMPGSQTLKIFSPGSSHRSKLKDRSQGISPRGSIDGSGAGVELVHHRKSHSMDTGSVAVTEDISASLLSSQSQNKTSQVLTSTRERFRCIVPYPPNSEYELELKLGDVIFVHKKREDGWYKGTQQRTGRTGLFPASFVQSF